MMKERHILLVCTVGGSPDAVTAAVKGSQPERIVFIASVETREMVARDIIPMLESEGTRIAPGSYDTVFVADAQNFSTCVEEMRRLGREVAKWKAKGEGFAVVADFTGGTKCMSAALALVARQWPGCTFSYIGGTERNKGGIGTVISGKEHFLHFENPWDSLGYQLVEEATLLFNRGDYQACSSGLEEGLKKVSRKDLKDGLNTFKDMAQGYLHWDLFQHKKAFEKLSSVLDRRAHLLYLMPEGKEDILHRITDNCTFLRRFEDGIPGRHTLLDLLANARRCAAKGRYDDAVARLYRAAEAVAQLRLHEQYGMFQVDDRGKPLFNRLKLEKTPEPLRTEWQGRASQDGFVALGLQDDYRLLAVLGDYLAEGFESLKGEKSVLVARNSSILAHGFEPVSEKAFSQLWQAVTALTGISEEQLPRFPTLGSSPMKGGAED